MASHRETDIPNKRDSIRTVQAAQPFAIQQANGFGESSAALKQGLKFRLNAMHKKSGKQPNERSISSPDHQPEGSL